MAGNTGLKNPYALQTDLQCLVVAFRHAANADYLVYDASRDKGRLVCPHCLEAELHYCAGSPTKRGDNERGAMPHFRSNELARHSPDCLSLLPSGESDDDQQEIDPSKGFKIHLNLGISKEEFCRAAMGENDLKGRKTFPAKNPKDFIHLMCSAQIQRVLDSVIIYHDFQIPWSEFFVRRTANDNRDKTAVRWTELAKKLQMAREGAETRRLFHIKIEDAPRLMIDGQGGGGRQRYTLPCFSAYIAAEERICRVQPFLQVTGSALNSLQVGKEYLVLTESPRLYKGKDCKKWYLDIPLSNPDRCCRVDLADIARKTKERVNKIDPSAMRHPALV